MNDAIMRKERLLSLFKSDIHGYKGSYGCKNCIEYLLKLDVNKFYVPNYIAVDGWYVGYWWRNDIAFVQALYNENEKFDLSFMDRKILNHKNTINDIEDLNDYNFKIKNFLLSASYE